MVGSSNTLIREITEQKLKVTEVFIHPEFELKSYLNDLCILRTSKMKRNKAVGPACLPTKNIHPEEGTLCWAAGWGKDGAHGKSTIRLQEVDLKVISDESCNQTQNQGRIFTGKMFCAGYLNGKQRLLSTTLTFPLF